MLDVARELETLYSNWDDLTEKLENSHLKCGTKE
jgi:hypothetical protein